MSGDYILLSIFDPTSGRRMDVSQYLSFTASQVIDRVLQDLQRDEPSSAYVLVHKGTNRNLSADRTMKEAGVVHGDALTLLRTEKISDAERSKTANQQAQENRDVPIAKAVKVEKEISTKKKGERWKREKSLSGGGQGDVYLVTDTTGEYKGHWVQKVLRNKNRIGRFEREIRAGLELSHFNVIKVIDYDLEADRPYFVAEYCSAGTLSKVDLSRFSIVERLRLFQGICRGVAYGHSQTPATIHRDIKPDNIFLRETGIPVVGDFGICFVDEEGHRLTLVDEAVGARNFIAPELEDGRTDEIGPWSDVYSLGKLLYWIISDKKIFSREKHRDPKYDITQTRQDAGIFFIYTLLDKMIVREPDRRFQNANLVDNEVGKIVERILMNAHPIDLKAPQVCLYCGIGTYQVVQAEGNYASSLPQDEQGIGLVFEGQRNYFIFVCDHCGNVQIFSVKNAKDPNVWKNIFIARSASLT